MTGQQAVAETLRQMVEGMDYTPVQRVIGDLTPEQATTRIPGAPYSMATIVWHAWFWVNAWLVAIRGGGDPFGGHDPDASWPEVPAEEWVATRARFIESIGEALRLARSEDPDRPTWEGQTVGQNLLQIAVHTAYHIGQMTLLRQDLGLRPPPAGE